MRQILSNLNCRSRNRTIRSFGQLKDNCHICMLLENFDKKEDDDSKLAQWLENHGLEDKAENVRKIDKTNSPEDTARDILKALFGDEKELSAHDKLEADIYGYNKILENLKNNFELNANLQVIYDKYQDIFKSFIKDFYETFNQCRYVLVLQKLLENKNLCGIIDNHYIDGFKATISSDKEKYEKMLKEIDEREKAFREEYPSPSTREVIKERLEERYGIKHIDPHIIESASIVNSPLFKIANSPLGRIVGGINWLMKPLLDQPSNYNFSYDDTDYTDYSSIMDSLNGGKNEY